MDTKFSVLFYGKTAKTTRGDLLPLYMRITINGKRLEISTQRYMIAGKWSTAAGKVKGKTEEARATNNYLDVLKAKAYQYQKELIQENKILTVQTFKEKWLGIQDSHKTVLPIFQEHNQHMEALVGQEFAPGTLERYRTSFDHTSKFIEWKHGVKGIELKKLDFEFISSYEFWLKSVRKWSHNTSVKYLSNFRKIINNSIRKGWLTSDPFEGFKMTKREVKRDYLI